MRDRKPFEAAVCGVWFAESMMYMAVYMGDSLAQELPLVGGHIHDWAYLLSRAGVVNHCVAIAAGVHALASLLAIGFVAFALRESFRAPEKDASEAELEPGQAAFPGA